jgi:PAS domain S-box-containing protein
MGSRKINIKVAGKLKAARATTLAARLTDGEILAQRLQFDELVNSVVDYAIFTMDPDGMIAGWNKGSERLKGWKADEINGQYFGVLYSDEDRAHGVPEHNLATATKDGIFRDVGWRQRKDGTRFMARVSLSAKYDEAGKLWGFTKVTQDLTEMLATEQLRREAAVARQQVEDFKVVNRMKDQLLDIFTHELRTPINAIMGFGSILDDELLGPLNDAQREYTHKVLVASDALLALVNNILDMARIQTGKLTLDFATIDFAEIVTGVIAAIAPEAIAKHQTMFNELRDDLPHLLADAPRVAQVLAVFLANAVKFTPDGGTIRVRAFVVDADLRCEVEDTGIGMTPDEVGLVFHLFTQIDMSSTREAGGMGLGLAIAKALVEAQHGTIGVRSKLGKGSTFWFALPVLSYSDRAREDAGQYLENVRHS